MTTLTDTNITKLVGFCKTQWVERFETFKNVLDLAEAVVTVWKSLSHLTSIFIMRILRAVQMAGVGILTLKLEHRVF